MTPQRNPFVIPAQLSAHFLNPNSNKQVKAEVNVSTKKCSGPLRSRVLRSGSRIHGIPVKSLQHRVSFPELETGSSAKEGKSSRDTRRRCGFSEDFSELFVKVSQAAEELWNLALLERREKSCVI